MRSSVRYNDRINDIENTFTDMISDMSDKITHPDAFAIFPCDGNSF
jgi:hypothetical protein